MFNFLGLLYIVFVVIITVIFLKSEKLQIKNGIKFEKLSAYFSVISSFAAVLSIGIIYLQLKEMQVQNQNTSRPDIFPSSAKLYIVDEQFTPPPGQNPEDTLSIQAYNVSEDTNKIKDYPYVELANIGLGAAKNISAVWKFDTKKIMEYIKGKYAFYSKPFIDTIVQLDFISATNRSEIKIPDLYLLCYGKKLNPCFEDVFSFADTIPKPDLFLEIYYEDIREEKYQKLFKVTGSAVCENVTLQFKKVDN